MLADGLSAAEVAEALRVPYQTVTSWARRYPLPTAKTEQAQQTQQPENRPEAPREPQQQPAPGLVGAGKRGALVAASRTDYLADRIALLEDAIREMLQADSVAWSTLPRMIQVQDELHSKRVDIIRTEGTRLDLSRDPVAVAREAEALEALLRSLALDLDETPEI